IGPRPRPRNRTAWSDRQSRKQDTWRYLLHSREHALQPHQLNRLRLNAAGATPSRPAFVGAVRQTSLQRTHNRSSPHCLHAGEFHRTSRSPPTLNHFKP
ncbi:unnamed protein product, partial [Brassica rapa subsp. trilocularis]